MLVSGRNLHFTTLESIGECAPTIDVAIVVVRSVQYRTACSTDCTTILLCLTEHNFLNSYHYLCEVLRMAYHHCFEMYHKPSSHHQLFHCRLQDLVCTCWQHCEQQWSCRWHICVFLCCRSCQFSTRQHKH